jgi:capsular polysaccharide biosynthesis protein
MTYYRSLKFYGDCIFVGSKQNFGHWLFDFLARLYYLPHDQIAGKKFVFGKLSAFQKECLPYFGIDLDQIVEMDQEDLPVRVASDYFFEHLTLLPVPPKLIAATFLHQRFVRDRHSAGPRRVYLSRGRYRPRHRVENEDEIVAFLQSQGFHICYPETLTVRQLIETLSNAEIVVTPYGATAANIIFCPQDTISIILLTDSWNEPIEVRNLENLRPYASYGYRAIRVQGKAVNRVHGFCLEENGIYALNDIAAALQTAQAMHANTRPPDPEPLP